MSQLRGHIEAIINLMGEKEAPIEFQLLKKYGKEMHPKKHPLRGSMKKQECYANAYALASNESAYRYCEGHATTKSLGLAIAHAWVIDRDGKVIDPTWKDGDHYFGVAFTPLFMYKVVSKTRHYGIFGNLYRLRMRPDCVFQYLENGLQSIAELP